MDHAGAVGGVERLRRLGENRESFFRRQAAFTMEPGAQGLAREEFHGQKDGGVRVRSVRGVARQVEDTTDVGMGDFAGKLDLPLEAGDHAAVGGDGGQQGLEGHVLLQFQVFGLVDLAHAAAA